MVQLSNERIQQMLHKETTKTEDRETVLRTIYTRYMHLYEQYFADIDALNNDQIETFRKYHEETRSLIKYYYLDIPHDTCAGIRKFEKLYTDNLLGPEWRVFLFHSYEKFKEREQDPEHKKSDDYYKAEFTKQSLADFYDAMDYVFRQGFGTESETGKNVISGIAGLLFGKEKK